MVIMKQIKLDFADLKYKPPKKVIEKVNSISVNLYPSGDYVKLRTAVAGYVKVKKENIICGNGGDEIIDMITRVYGDVVLIPIPTFSQFEIAAKRRKSKILSANCFKDDKYELNLPDESLKKATLVWICNPNNPTGTKIPREKIIEVLEKTKAMVVVDECYYEYLGETVTDLINKFDNLIVMRSFSKNFGIAGLRLGFAVSNKKNIEEIEKVRQIFNVNKIVEEIVPELLEEIGYYRAIWKEVESIRETFSKDLNKLGLKVLKSYTNFILVKFKDQNTAKSAYEGLKKRNIFVFPAWDEEFSGLKGPYIRFTIGTKEEMEIVLKTLKELLS